MNAAPKRSGIQELPEGWIEVNLNVAVESMKNGLYKPANEYAEHGVACLRMYNIDGGRIVWKNIKRMLLSSDEVNEYRLAPGDLLVNRVNSRELVGKTAVFPRGLEPCVYESKNIRVRLRSGLVNSDFVNYQLLLFGQRYFNYNSQQVVGMASISQPQIGDFPLLLPPRIEQDRIVSMVQAMLAAVKKSSSHIVNVVKTLERFRQSVLAAACSGRLTSDAVLSEGELPPLWQQKRIGSLFSVRTGGTPSRKVKEYFVRGTVPWVKTGELKNTAITSVEEYITQRAVEESNAKVFPVGTILIAMYGEGKTRGQVGRLTFPAATNQACAALVNSTLPLETKDFIFSYLLSQYENLRAEAVGGNQPNLNLSMIKEWKVPIPPLHEQREIVRRVNVLLTLADSINRRVVEASCRCDSLTKSILAKAFRGELVPTEAELARSESRDYEGASVLLERIRAERANHAKSPPTSRRNLKKSTALVGA